MCTHVKTSEFVPALICEIAEKTGKETFHIPESVLWKVVDEIEDKCWSNVILSRPLLDDLVEFMRRHKTYGSSFIEYDLRKEDRPLVLKGVDNRHRVAMSNYFFDSNTNWYSVLHIIVTERISISEDGEVRFLDDNSLDQEERSIYRTELIDA